MGGKSQCFAILYDSNSLAIFRYICVYRYIHTLWTTLCHLQISYIEVLTLNGMIFEDGTFGRQ